MIHPRNDILHGWKDIAAYVARDVRTAERWEKQRGLPVHRVPGEGRSAVYAVTSELDSWLSSRDALPIEPAAPPLQPAAQPLPAPLPPPPPNRFPRLSQLSAAALFLALLTVAAVTVEAHHRRPTPPPPLASSAPRRIPPKSPIPGVDDLYLQGVYFAEQRTPETLDRALRSFSQAIARDPAYAPAYSGLATTYDLLREDSMMPPAEAYPKARAAALRAIALDPSLPEPHASLGFTRFFWEWDAPAAEREFRTALQLDPSSAVAHHWYGSMLLHQARYPEALNQLDLALRLQPTSTSVVAMRALALGLSGHRDEALSSLRSALDTDPGSPAGHSILATLSLIQPRDIPSYFDQLSRSAELRHDTLDLQSLAAAQRAFRLSGEPGAWQAYLDSEHRLHPDPTFLTYRTALAEAALGHTDAAFAALSQLAARRDPALLGLRIDPILAPLHSDPRFPKLLAALTQPRPE